jgi:hypothetical protein
MRTSTIAALSLLAAFSYPTCAAECKKGLSDQVEDVHLTEASSLTALLRFAFDNGLCIGVENPGVDLLNHPVRFEAARPVVLSALQSLLGGGRYQISEQRGVILIRNMEAMGHDTELDVIIPEFKTDRISVPWANMALLVRVVMLADPSLQGFAGNVSDRIPEDKVGPFDEKGRTVREILTLIVGQSGGGAWVSGRCPTSRRGDEARACWDILQFQEDPTTADSVTKEIVRKRADELSQPKAKKQR